MDMDACGSTFRNFTAIALVAGFMPLLPWTAAVTADAHAADA